MSTQDHYCEAFRHYAESVIGLLSGTLQTDNHKNTLPSYHFKTVPHALGLTESCLATRLTRHPSHPAWCYILQWSKTKLEILLLLHFSLVSRPSHFAQLEYTNMKRSLMTLMVNSEESLKGISNIFHMINLLCLAFCSIFDTVKQSWSRRLRYTAKKSCAKFYFLFVKLGCSSQWSSRKPSQCSHNQVCEGFHQ